MTAAASRPRLGYLTADLGVPFERELLTHALRRANRLGVELVATCGGPAGHNADARASAYERLRQARLEGLVLCAHTVCVGMDRQEIARFARGFAPAKVVVVGLEVPGFGCHTVSNASGAAALTEHLLVAHGRRRFAVVCGPAGHDEAEQRLRGIESALARHGVSLPRNRIFPGDFSKDAGEAAAERMLAEEPGLAGIDAVLFANDLMAISALDVFARAKISIPGSVSIAGFDDIELAHLARTPLTTVRQPLSQQVSGALDELLDAVVNGEKQPALLEHRTRLVLRRSCGCGLVTTEYASSAPPPPDPSRDPRDVLVEYGAALAADLTTTMRESSLPRALSDAWAVELVETFLGRIVGSDQNFIEKIDASASALVQQDEPLRPLREAVLLLRRQLLALTGKTGSAAEDLDNATAEALLTIGSVEALREAQRRRAFEAVAVELAAASAALSSAGSVAELASIAYGELDRLGLGTCVPVLFDEGKRDIPFAYVRGVREAPLPAVEDGELVLPRGGSQDLLLVPMTAQHSALGYVLYAANPETFLVATRFTLALGAALRSAVLMERLELAYEQIARQALTDSLTGLWNRRYLAQRLREEMASGQGASGGLSICMIDLDGFKQVNDRHGHDAGDRVLALVAAELKRALGPRDIAARLGGDEFVALLPNAGPEAAMVTANRVVKALERCDEHRIITASVGVASIVEREPEGDGAALLRDADAALLTAKRRGKSQAVHFSETG
jgi:diguanylate cyclase (GGDEF)-like protein